MSKDRVGQFQIIDHGAEHAQYFQGCGTASTKFKHVVTGCGDTPRAALDDALEQIASGAYGISWDVEALEARGDYLQERADLSTESAIPTIEPGDEDPDDAPGDVHPEWHHYVSIRWNAAPSAEETIERIAEILFGAPFNTDHEIEDGDAERVRAALNDYGIVPPAGDALQEG